MDLSVEQGTLFVERLGSGPPVLVMHGGLGLDHTVFRPWLDPLAGSAELIFYDHLGNGRSALDGDPESLTHALWVDSADTLRERLGHERVYVLGHSHGAILALEYALRHPQSLRGLVLCGAAPAFDYPERVMANAQRKAPDEATYRLVVELLSGPLESDRAWEEGFRTIHPLYFHDYDAEGHDPVLEDVRFRAEAVNRGTACLATYDIEERLGEIAVPTLVLSGADDWVMPPEHAGERVVAGIPGAEHVVFEASGHWPFVEERERFLRVVGRWLARVEAGVG